MPVLSKIKGKEREISREQVALALRLRNSAYYEMEDKKADGESLGRMYIRPRPDILGHRIGEIFRPVQTSCQNTAAPQPRNLK